MTEEEKGFTIKDRRSFDEEGSLKDEKEDSKASKEDSKASKEDSEAIQGDAPEGEAEKEATKRAPLPEVNFNSLIFSLSSSALLHLGEIADPQSGQKQKDTELAKHTIDTIALLKEKTEGNLTEEENKFLESVLTDLRWRYVKAVE